MSPSRFISRVRDVFDKASNKIRQSPSYHGSIMHIEPPSAQKCMIDRDAETSLRYLREVIRNGKAEVIPSAAQAVLNSLVNSKHRKDPAFQDALINLLKFVDAQLSGQSTSKIDQFEGMRMVDELQKELLASRSRDQAEESISSYEVEEPDEGIGSSISNASTGPDTELDDLLCQLNLRKVAKFEPKFPEIDADSDDEGGVLTEERKEERAEKHGQKTCEEEVETLADGTEVRRKKTRTVNMSQSSRQVVISTRGGNGPMVSRRFADGKNSMNDDTDFETTDFFSSPLARMRRDRANFLGPEEPSIVNDGEKNGSEPGQSQKTRTVEATSEITQSVAQKTQKNGRTLAENAAHKIDTTDLKAKQIDTFRDKQLIDRKGDGTYEEATIVRGGLPGIERNPHDSPVKKHVVEYIQTFDTKKDPNADEFLRGTTLATYVRLNDSLRLHEEQFRKKLTFEFSTSGELVF
ncbi:unnamed protein product, partial [Mesorhabditis spiculigera]